jgi:hypothetical protein
MIRYSNDGYYFLEDYIDEFMEASHRDVTEDRVTALKEAYRATRARSDLAKLNICYRSSAHTTKSTCLGKHIHIS